MKWYAEQLNVFGRYARSTSEEYPPDRTADGAVKHYRVRVQIAPEHEQLTLHEIVEIYGTKTDCK